MKTIAVLPKEIADKIAAGEVVDRPVSIVKELLENAIDAGADSITVEIKNGGKTYIRVTDNGCGIEKEQAETAFLRHATSKIKAADDLFAIETLGFRGEALASIAAVSKTELITKTSNDKSGISLVIEGGQTVRKTDIGCPDGTTIVVSELFYNTPARLKFLKADSSESSLIIDLVSKMALAYAYIKIRMISNGNILFSTTGKGNTNQNILTVFGKEIGDGLIHYYAGNEAGRADLEVFLSSQGNTRGNRKYQIFFVNGRYVHSKLLDQAVSAAYRQKIPDGRFPIVFLFYHPDPATLDVNIHPNKKEVRFADEKSVSEFVSQAIMQALETKSVMPSIHIQEENAAYETQAQTYEIQPKTHQTQAQDDAAQFFAQKRKLETAKMQEMSGLHETTKQQEIQQTNKTREKQEFWNAALPKPEEKQIQTEWDIYKGKDEGYNIHRNILNIKATGTVFNTYITGYDEEYFYLIDQHAAHERIFYEHLTEMFAAEDKRQQMIMEPLLIEVPIAVKEEFGKTMQYLFKIGFEIQLFGRKSYKVSSIPSYMSIGEAKDFLMDFMDHVSESTDFTDQKKMDKIIVNACKKAVKAHDNLDILEIEKLLQDLSKVKNPYSCPHGRPVFLKLSQHEIERMFKRI